METATVTISLRSLGRIRFLLMQDVRRLKKLRGRGGRVLESEIAAARRDLAELERAMVVD